MPQGLHSVLLPSRSKRQSVVSRVWQCEHSFSPVCGGGELAAGVVGSLLVLEGLVIIVGDEADDVSEEEDTSVARAI